MPTYIYETIPQSQEVLPTRFEVRQSMSEKPLTQHPDNGTPVRRVIIGGTGFAGAKPSASSATTQGGCGTGCGCH